MLYIAENLKALRKGKEWTQEEMAEMIGVSPQSVSKWERGDTFPDITLLPALANLYKVSVDSIIGMDKINEAESRNTVFTTAREHWRNGDLNSAVNIFNEALKTFPNDKGIMSDLAMLLALEGGTENLDRAITLCERVLSGNSGEKVHHTTRAALCFIYYKAGLKEEAMNTAKNLPHSRESREKVRAELKGEPRTVDIDAYLRFIAIGEESEIEKIVIAYGEDMGIFFSKYNLFARIGELEKELASQSNGEGGFPFSRCVGQTWADYPPGKVKVTYCGEDYLDKEFADSADAVEEVLLALRKIAQR